MGFDPEGIPGPEPESVSIKFTQDKSSDVWGLFRNWMNVVEGNSVSSEEYRNNILNHALELGRQCGNQTAVKMVQRAIDEPELFGKLTLSIGPIEDSDARN